MTTVALHPDVQTLLKAMRELEQFLKQNDEDFWAAEVGQAADHVAKSDAYGLKRFLALFGGMGSLNDLVLQRDGKVLAAEDQQLQVLLSRASSLASQLWREECLSGVIR